MKPYYQDEYTTIYNSNCNEKQADVIILDPPFVLNNILDYKANTIFLCCGTLLLPFYWKEVNPRRAQPFLWIKQLYDNKTERWIPYFELMLVIGDLDIDITSPPVYQLLPLGQRFHLWEKPVELFTLLLSQSNGLILDPFMGSGSTLVASKLLKRKSIGYDTDIKCCQIAAKRLEEL